MRERQVRLVVVLVVIIVMAIGHDFREIRTSWYCSVSINSHLKDIF